MIEIEEKDTSPKTFVGQFGTVEVNEERLNATSYREKEQIKKSMKRFSNNGDFVIEVTNYSSLDGTEESFLLEPKFIFDGNMWEIWLRFRNISGKYSFAGMFGAYGIPGHSHQPIHEEIYAQVLNIVSGICNPDFDYGNDEHNSSQAIDSIIDLLREKRVKRDYYNPYDIDRDFLSHWDKVIVKYQEEHRAKIKEKLAIPKGSN